jgi:hypothetical protein
VTTHTMDRDNKVTEASSADLSAAIEHALRRCGLSFSELARQASSGRFKSLDARLAWVAIGDLWGAGEPGNRA